MSEPNIIPMRGRKPLFRRSFETNKLVDALSKLRPGDQVSYADLSRDTGLKINGGTPALCSARRILRNENGIITEPVWGVGIRRLNDGEIVKSSVRDVMRIQRGSRRAAEKIAHADYRNLDDEGRRQFTAHAAVFGAIAAISGSNGVKRIAEAVGNRAELPISETLALFKRE